MTTPTVIKMSIQRMACTACGAEANASCNCGVSYVPKAVQAAEAVKANPEKSDRAIAGEIGVSPMTVNRARSTVPDVTVKMRTGLDGKARKLPALRKQPAHRLRAAEAAFGLSAIDAIPKSDASKTPSVKPKASVKQNIALESSEEITIEDELEPEEYREVFLFRTADALSFAFYSGPVDDEVIAAAKRVAAKWKFFAETLEARKHSDFGVAADDTAEYAPGDGAQ